MEKFGIFELLDALSALTDTETQSKPIASEEHTEEKREQKKVPDAAFSSPTYGAPQTELPAGEGQALGDFLARHDEISRKARR